MSVSLDDIWSEPLAVSSPRPPPTSDLHVENESDEENTVFRRPAARRSSLFLTESDEEADNTSAKAPVARNPSQPDIDSLFDDLEAPVQSRKSGASKPFDLAALRREAQARIEKEAPPSSLPQYAVQSSSPPRDGFDAIDKAADEAGPKKREVPKLDETRLLGKNGLHALIQMRTDFKPKGKGQELADLNRLFSLYHFWAHKMYPKTQFSDTVNRIEKLCHSKRMHSALQGWRQQANESVNGRNANADEDADMHSVVDDESGDEQRRERDKEDVFGPRRANTAMSADERSSSPASSVAPGPPASHAPSSASENGGDVIMADDDDPFDIEALLQQEEEMRREAAAAANSSSVKTKGGSAGRDFTFDESDVALWAELDDSAFADDPGLSSSVAGKQKPRTSTTASNSSSGWDDDEWAILDEMESEQQRIKRTAGNSVPKPTPSSKDGTEHPPPETMSLSGSISNMEVVPADGNLVKSATSNDDDWDDMYV